MAVLVGHTAHKDIIKMDHYVLIVLTIVLLVHLSLYVWPVLMAIHCMPEFSVGVPVRMAMWVWIGCVCNVVVIVGHVLWLMYVCHVSMACTCTRGYVLIHVHPNITKILSLPPPQPPQQLPQQHLQYVHNAHSNANNANPHLYVPRA